jgi:hypothetical protein
MYNISTKPLRLLNEYQEAYAWQNLVIPVIGKH